MPYALPSRCHALQVRFAPASLGALAEAIAQFGETNRKTALSLALAMSTEASRQVRRIGLLLLA